MKTSPQIDYKKELEVASKGMIMIHDPKILIKLMVRNIVRKVKIKHAGMILYEPHEKAYVLTISRGEPGVKVPAGFARFAGNNPLIEIFIKSDYADMPFRRSALVLDDLNKMIWEESLFTGGKGVRDFLHRVIEQMQMYNTIACVPAYYQDNLLAVLLLGAKIDEEKFDPNELAFFSALASDVAMAIKNAQLFADLKKESDRNRDLFLRTTFVLASAIEAKDKYTRGHTERVTNYSLLIAKQMTANGSMTFPENFMENLYISGLLHDIGKIAVPEAILGKTDKLNDEELKIMRTHTLRGVEMLKPLAEFEESMKGVKYHHERYDGKGYPDGLKADEIPIIAAIIAVADTFDAMTSDRPYRKGLDKAFAMEEIKKNPSIQFNPLPVKAMVELWEKGEI